MCECTNLKGAILQQFLVNSHRCVIISTVNIRICLSLTKEIPFVGHPSLFPIPLSLGQPFTIFLASVGLSGVDVTYE
jgi:hypothetical protein